MPKLIGKELQNEFNIQIHPSITDQVDTVRTSKHVARGQWDPQRNKGSKIPKTTVAIADT